MDSVIHKKSSPQRLLFFKLIRDRFGINLDVGKNSFLNARLLSRMRKLNFHSLDDYFEATSRNSEELQLCSELLTTHMTEWYREIIHFKWIRPQLKKIVREKGKVRIWSAACSSGEEVYSLLFLALREGLKPHQIQILGTDLSRQILNKAVNLVNTPEFEKQIDFLKMRFDGTPEQFNHTINLALETSIKFREFNLIESKLPPNFLFDFILLRNVLIYFDHSTTLQTCNHLAKHLYPDGHLVIGLSESLKMQGETLETIGNSIYRLKQQKSKAPQWSAQKNQRVTLKPIDAPLTLLIVEDSPTLRKILKSVYDKIPNVEVVGETGSIEKAFELYEKFNPDIVSLDMKLEDGSGLELLKRASLTPHFKKSKFILVTDCSPLEGNLVFDALALGAHHYLQKPQAHNLGGFQGELAELIKDLSLTARPTFEKSTHPHHPSSSLKLTMDAKFILIGSSTGGTEIVRDILAGLPKKCPPILIVQHMPETFTGIYAHRLSKQTGRPTIEVRASVKLEEDHAYIAGGGLHLEIVKNRGEFWAEPRQGDPVNRFKPSVSVLFGSAHSIGISPQTIAIILTGMGRDGADPLLQLKQNGALTFAQSQESCVVFGMPKAAVELGAVDYCEPPSAMIRRISQLILKHNN